MMKIKNLKTMIFEEIHKYFGNYYYILSNDLPNIITDGKENWYIRKDIIDKYFKEKCGMDFELNKIFNREIKSTARPFNNSRLYEKIGQKAIFLVETDDVNIFTLLPNINLDEKGDLFSPNPLIISDLEGNYYKKTNNKSNCFLYQKVEKKEKDVGNLYGGKYMTIEELIYRSPDEFQNIRRYNGNNFYNKSHRSGIEIKNRYRN